ncbi:hypothetical protein PCANC_03101 [Puccinia coronata f. sp. avenae]|uniref:Uncharacterized protein n=1 Tax=Puccinia coronata f. sp. avenae TaxID=200324 RepID=A0A2N5W4L0_9BASI|nr:hypothetical protein PCANC_07346 [Puccinia coronata f. sp. avenae]PLW57171.1 hypothetical protein PCANC_03101 [Puccinia coronata f. sp. avenae]
MRTVVSSTRPLLLFFVFLVICIDHLSYSLTTSPALHKRAEETIEALSGAVGGTRQAKLGKIHPVELEGGDNSFRAVNEEKLHIDPTMAEITGKKQTLSRLRSSLNPISWGRWILKNLKGTLSRIIQKFKDLVGVQKKSGLSENFLHVALWEHPGLQQLVQEDKSIDDKIDEFTKVFLKDHSESETLDPALNKEEVAQLKKSLHELHNIWREDVKILQKSRSTTKAGDEIIHLTNENVLNHFQTFGERMAQYRSQFLAEEQEALLEHLPRNQHYLINALDKRLGLGKTEEQVKAKVSISNAKFKIDIQEDALGKILGGHDKLYDLLETITNSDFHKDFMQELKMPRSMTGYKLQLLESWKRMVPFNEDKKLSYKELGLPNYEGHNPEEINKWATELDKDISKTLKVYLKREKEEKNLMKILKPEGFESLMNYMKPHPSPRK